MTDGEKAIAFCKDIFEQWPESLGFEGFELQALAETHGLLIKTQPTKACGEKGECSCAEYHDGKDFANGDVDCYRRAPFLSHGNTANDEKLI